MEPLFRLSLVRPAVSQGGDRPSIELSQQSTFQAALAAASTSEQPRVEAHKAAAQFVGSAGFVGDPSRTPLAAQTAAFTVALSRLLGAPPTQPGALRTAVVKAVRDSYGSEPSALVAGQPYLEAVTRLRDSLLAIKYLPREHGRPLAALTEQLRHLDLIARVAADPSFPVKVDEARRSLRRPLRLPGSTGLEPELSTRAAEQRQREREAQAAAARRERAAALLTAHRRLREAVGELTGLGGENLLSTSQVEVTGAVPPAEYQPPAALTRQVQFHDRLGEANLRALGTPVPPAASVDAPGNEAGSAGGPASVGAGAVPRTDGGAEQAAASAPSSDAAGEGDPPAPPPPPLPPVEGAAHLAGQLFGARPDLLSGSTPFKPSALSDRGFRLHQAAADKLSSGTRTVLADRGISPVGQPLDRIVDTLRDEQDVIGGELETLVGRPARRSVKRVGNTLVTVSTPLPSPWTALVVGTTPPPEQIPLEDDRVPRSRGTVAPSGVADLILVRQQLVGYEGADIAHIENVLRGESKQREHTRRQETEQITVTESEVTTTEERELESTDRYEMTRESSTVIKEDAQLKAGLTVSGKYGPTVEFTASAEGSQSRNREEATKSAAVFAQDVTQRSANRISERVLERTSLRITTEVTEKNSHGLDNRNGMGNISGVYQWVNKVYEAQMYNYGLRTMFDFMIPEPAAYFVQTLQSAHASAVDLAKPEQFTLRPDQITELNYAQWVRLYDATDVSPPPEPYRTKSFDYKAGGGDSKTDYTHSGQVSIDDGYMAVQVSCGALYNLWQQGCVVDVLVGNCTHRFIPDGNWLWTAPLAEERDSVPVAIKTWRVAQVAVGIEVKCQRTERAMSKWALDTHAKLTNAYRARLAEYEERLAALQLQAGVPIHGRNPRANQLLIADELRKNCVSILTDQHFDLFGAIEVKKGPDGSDIPQIDVREAAAEGAYVRFFEQAIEWEHLTWLAYPYFWGRKDQWDERLSYDDPDPQFNQFLKAGYCRVTVPVRPGFEGAIDHYMNFGELWSGGPLPPITSPLYLPIAEEIAERLDRPGAEVPQGDPWRVRIPTTLVRLRPDDALPTWRKDGSGEWVEG
ncbi:hypothetical protein [Streptomyces buecherae]|uniref:Uncharacterized protein n=1 Tax=Streptomyces buecherae TaxID=2763006 RepID=A0A7H8N2F3_9ACTN|nr:hypothetical protein [Streptomyces buecherae]QKW48687.1 hypothetical protein HUT08_03040 [Streptomyces buecherae]